MASKYATRPLRATMATAPGKLLASICRDRAGAIRARRSLERPTSSGVAVGSAWATRGSRRRTTPNSDAASLCMGDLRGESWTKPGPRLGGGILGERRGERKGLAPGLVRMERPAHSRRPEIKL